MLKKILCALVCFTLAMPAMLIANADYTYAETKQIKKKKTKTVHRAGGTRHSARLKVRKAATRTVSANDLNITVWPDPVRTPGFTNPDVSQANIKSTVCKSGWTTTIRPPTSYTNGLKATQIGEYGFKDKSLASYEEDHLISLQLGGHPTDPRNLWPEAYAGTCGARVKDVIETKLKKLVCAGQITLAEAQQEIAQNWVGAYIKYVREISCPAMR